MASKKLFIGIFLILITCTNKIVGQNIELEQVHIECIEKVRNDTVEYEPYRMGFTFRAINETSDFLSIGAYNATRLNIPLKYGFFEFESSTKEKFSLYSRGVLRCVHPNDTISLIGELIEDDLDYNFLRQFRSKSEICDCIVNSQFSYTCIEEDYNSNDCKTSFPSQNIVMKNYIITFISDGIAFYDYSVGW